MCTACALQALGEELPQLPPTTPRPDAEGNVAGAAVSSHSRGAAEAAAVPVLAKAFHEALAAREIPFEIARQIVPGGARTREEMALQWVGCVLGHPLLGLSAFKVRGIVRGGGQGERHHTMHHTMPPHHASPAAYTPCFLAYLPL